MGDSSRNVVEIIFRTSWMTAAATGGNAGAASDRSSEDRESTQGKQPAEDVGEVRSV